MTHNNNKKQFIRVVRESGWHSDCANSPKPGLASAEILIKSGEGWEPCPHDHTSREGYEYALQRGCVQPGFKGIASAQYYFKVRRPL